MAFFQVSFFCKHAFLQTLKHYLTFEQPKNKQVKVEDRIKSLNQEAKKLKQEKKIKYWFDYLLN